MNHEDYELCISKFADNILQENETAGLFTHLGGCEECREFFQSTMRMRLAIHNSAVIPLSKEIDSKIFAATINKQPRRISFKGGVVLARLWRGKVSVPLPVAAALVFLFVLAGTVISSLWWEANKSTTEYYIPTLPTVEVRGYYDAPQHSSSREVKQ